MKSSINRTSTLIVIFALSLVSGLFTSGCTFGVGIDSGVVDTCAEFDAGYGDSVAAYDCDVVYAYSGSLTDAYEGSTVHAYEGATVYAHYGSLVYAYAGSTVYADAGAEIIYSH